MFGRKTPTAVGPHTHLRGTFTCGEDDLVVAGTFEGAIASDATVTVAEGGLVVGDIEARVVVVAGRVEGSVVARERLSMRPPGRIEGDARYGSLEVERGAVIEGRTSPLDQPPAVVLEGAAPSPVEETMRFASFSAQGVDARPGDDAAGGPEAARVPEAVGSQEPTPTPADANRSAAGAEGIDRKTTPVTAPARRPAVSGGPRDTDTWGLGVEPGEPKPAD